MTAEVNVQRVAEFLLSQERFFSKLELNFAKNLMRWLPYRQNKVNSKIYLDELRQKKLKAHRQQALFIIDIFEACGAVYGTV